MRQNLYRYADVLQLHPTSSGHWRNDTGADVEYPDQSDREPVGNDDWDCIDKIKSHFLIYGGKCFFVLSPMCPNRFQKIIQYYLWIKKKDFFICIFYTG